MTERDEGHLPVLVGPVLELLDPQPGACVVDCTLGLAGHARMLAERIGPRGRLIGVDLDEGNLAVAEERLQGVACRRDFVYGNFAELDVLLDEVGVDRVDRILADLGLSSNQLRDAERGFTFQEEGPLDMRMDRGQGLTAIDLVNRLSERELADLIFHNAQERFSRKIAKRICQGRRRQRIRSTRKLAELVVAALEVDEHSRKSKIHPATRTFLALRMAVNDELGNLRNLLAKAPGLLKPGGRIGVIAFHSVEDREVKVDFRQKAKGGIYSILTKRPVIAGPEERRENPRSRSAKLRVAERTDQPP